MSKALRTILVMATLVATVATTAACGGSDAPHDVVAQVGKMSITRSQLNHWMATIAAGDYYEYAHSHTIPAGLVSDPPDYSRCVSRLRLAVTVPKVPAATLLTKCRQLNQAIRVQAMSYLVNAYWFAGLVQEQGISARGADVRKMFNQIKARRWPKRGAFRAYLASNRRSIADELFVVKMDLLSQKAQEEYRPNSKRLLATFTEAGRRWTAKTDCRAGYVVQHCRQYTGNSPTYSGPPPAILMEQLATLVGLECVNRPACG